MSTKTTKAILITERIKDAINEFLGVELIPACAVGNHLSYVNGNLMVSTFINGELQGYRRLDPTGEITNIITELVG